MNKVAHFVVLADGWRRNLTAFMAGAAGALALPPIGFFPFMIIPMTVSVWMLDGCGAKAVDGMFWRRVRSAALAGWWLGFGYFVAGLYWLGAAFLVEPDRFAWALPLGVFGLPAILACFTALGFVASFLLWTSGGARVFSLALGLGLAEIARGVLFTGFPWNEFGMALGQNALLAQAASFFGLYGLNPIVIALGAAPATIADSRARHWFTSPIALAAALFAMIAAFGELRMRSNDIANTPGVRLRIMQPNLQQDAKFRPSAGGEILRRYLDLSDRSTSPTSAGLANVTHLIWPESAFPFVLSREPQALSMISAALGDHTTLLTGAIRIEGEGKAARAFNSLLVVSGDGQIRDSSDKVHLVPFGEYLPASRFLRAIGLRQFIALPGGFSAGTYRHLMNAPGLPPFQPLICYEAIFPGEATPAQRDGGQNPRPAFLLNVTNDGWFGMTSGPYQHFAEARLRSIEEGLPLVRAANTGISAVIDPYGRVVKELPLGVAGVLDSDLPKPIVSTVFSRYPWASVVLLFLLIAVAALAGRPRIDIRRN